MGHKLFSYSTILYLFPLVSPFAYCGQLDFKFYDKTCPSLPMIVRNCVWAALSNDTRIAASLLRLHFHDCLVNGCDASVLLDYTKDFKGEKNAFPNRNSARGGSRSKRSCLFGGPFWPVELGRRDGTTASEQAANEQLPSHIEPLENIAAKFTSKGLDVNDFVVLSGAHTIGFAQCFTFKRRLFDFKGSGKPDSTLDSSALKNLQSMCPNNDASDSNLAPLDIVSVNKFDNVYFTNLLNNTGLLESDQALMGDPKIAAMVNSYSMYPNLFFNDFTVSMRKLGNVGILSGKQGRIRKKCWYVK